MPKMAIHIIPFGSTLPVFDGVGTKDITRFIFGKVIWNTSMTNVILLSIEKSICVSPENDCFSKDWLHVVYN